MKIRALPKFEGIKDLERNVFPKAGDVWETSEERANFLKEHGVVEFVEPELTEEEKPYEAKFFETKKVEVKPKFNKKKKRKD